jgi:hypothetical protein
MEISLVLFALTKRRLAELFDLARGREAAIWVNKGLLETADLARLRADGFDLTDFTYWVDPADGAAIQHAVEIIKEHHPDKVLYIEPS